MSLLVLMRHGNTFEQGERARFVGARSDLELTLRGREQAANAGKFLNARGVKINRVVSGSLKRQVESAKFAAETCGYTGNREVDASLNEIDYGPWEGMTPEDIQTHWPKEFKAWQEDRTWPSELFPQSEAWFKGNISSWLDSSSIIEGTSLAVTSNGVLIVLHELLSARGASVPKDHSKVRTGGICIVKYYAGKYAITAWNVDPENESASAKDLFA